LWPHSGTLSIIKTLAGDGTFRFPALASAPQKRFSIEGFPGEGGRDGKIQGDNRYGGEHIDICSVFLLVLRVNQN